MPATTAPASQTWDAVLSQLTLRVTRQNYDTWLRNTAGLRFDGDTLVVATTSDLACDWLSTRMRSVIAQALGAVTGADVNVRFEPSQAATTASRLERQPSLLPSLIAPLNPRFTFETLLEADFNRLALSAAQDIVDGSDTYSPLFITSDPGCGKTHLLHAMAHEAGKRGASFVLVSSEKFLSEFTTAVRNKTGAAFRSRYHDTDLLLVDDVHMLIGKKATLSELYQTIAALHDCGRRVVVTGDASVMAHEDARFQSQLCWGLVASIGPASVADRERFIATKASQQGAALPKEVQDYLALRIKSSIRDLEGAVNRITALARITRAPITIEFAARALQPIGHAGKSELDKPACSASRLIEAVCSHLNTDAASITSARRSRDLTYARHLAMYLLRQDGGLTYSAIATVMHKKDHSTVVHACAQVNKDLASIPSVRADLDAIRSAAQDTETAA